MPTDRQLIEAYIDLNPRRPSEDRAELKDFGIEVWALVAYYQDAAQGDIDAVARAYEIPREAVEAALAYYRAHREAIDARMIILKAAIA